MAAPAVSIIIPVYNSAGSLGLCLAAIRDSAAAPHEIIVADDGSTDDSEAVAERFGARVIRLKERAGPAAARNAGASLAIGEILFFLDADVCVHADGIGRVQQWFAGDPSLAAVMGCYDDAPAELNFLSQYRNLMHAYYHRSGNARATTFWTGCGAVRAEAFHAVGGFDAVRYRHSSIEDIDLGYRLHARGFNLLLDRDLQAKHLKRWTLPGVIRTDLFARAIPWTELILAQRHMPDDLNLRGNQRLSVALAWMAMMSLVKWPFASVMLLAVLTGLNWQFYGFLGIRRGWVFAARVIPLHWLYFVYSGVGFVAGALKSLLKPGFRQPTA